MTYRKLVSDDSIWSRRSHCMACSIVRMHYIRLNSPRLHTDCIAQIAFETLGLHESSLRGSEMGCVCADVCMYVWKYV